jgi:hypothetical protein
MYHYKIWPSRSYAYVGIMSFVKTKHTIIEKEHNIGFGGFMA